MALKILCGRGINCPDIQRILSYCSIICVIKMLDELSFSIYHVWQHWAVSTPPSIITHRQFVSRRLPDHHIIIILIELILIS